jgi:hypothetical protein
MLLSVVSVLVVAQTSSEIPEGLMNNPVHVKRPIHCQLNCEILLCDVILDGKTDQIA